MASKSLSGRCARRPVETIFATPSISQKTLSAFLEKKIPCYYISDGIMKKVTEKTYVIPLLAIVDMALVNQLEKPRFLLVLDNVIDHGNIGTIARTAKAFGIDSVASTNTKFDYGYKKTIDASRGAIFSIHWQCFATPEQAVTELQKSGYFIVVTSPHAPRLQSQLELPQKPIALVIGNETSGASKTFQHKADALIQIPMSSTIESLNVGIAAGISIYELKLKLILAMLKKQIEQALGRHISVTSKLIHQAFDSAIKNITELSAAQIIFLMILKSDELMNMDQISKDVALFGKELEDFLQPLFEQKLIEKKHNGISITAGGELFLAQIWPTKEKIEAEILEGFSKEDEKAFRDYLKRIQNNCYSIIERSNEHEQN